MTRISGRVLALDIGKRRIGLAMTDPLGIIVRGLPTYTRKRVREDIDYLAAVCLEHGVQRLLVGLPLHMSGEESGMSRYTTEFGQRLGDRTGLPIEYADERLTSFEAEVLLKESGQQLDRRTGNVDRMAAIILLQDYLDQTEAAGQDTAC